MNRKFEFGQFAADATLAKIRYHLVHQWQLPADIAADITIDVWKRLETDEQAYVATNVNRNELPEDVRELAEMLLDAMTDTQLDYFVADNVTVSGSGGAATTLDS